jgi:hypothetical protein
MKYESDVILIIIYQCISIYIYIYTYIIYQHAEQSCVANFPIYLLLYSVESPYIIYPYSLVNKRVLHFTLHRKIVNMSGKI